MENPKENQQSDEWLIRTLRPKSFSEYVGQTTVVPSLKVAVEAARKRNEPLDHILFHGPPGLGKTTLAGIVAKEMDAKLVNSSGPSIERPADCVGILSNLALGDILFIDEIHRLPKSVEEYLYSAMEDFRVDFMTGSGAFARNISMPLKCFTLIGSTTRSGMLSAPLRDRFGLQYHLEFYQVNEIEKVISRSAKILGCEIGKKSINTIAVRSRGTPRIANRLLRRVRDFAEVKHGGTITQNGTIKALELEGVDEWGLDRLDTLYLKAIIYHYHGGPVGIEAISATVNEDHQTLIDTVEPFLLKGNMIIRTPKGRRITSKGLAHITAKFGPVKTGYLSDQLGFMVDEA